MFQGIRFIVLLALLGTAQAQVYKWVDAQGRTQYSDAPPNNPAIRPTVIATPPAENPAKTVDWSEKEREFRQRQAAQQQPVANPEKDKACNDARKAVAYWKSVEGIRASRYTADGARVYYSDEEREKLKADADKAVATHCRP